VTPATTLPLAANPLPAADTMAASTQETCPITTTVRALGLVTALAASSFAASSASAAEKSSGVVEFMNQIRALCGASFAGRVVTNLPKPDPIPEDPFEGKVMIMHVRDCTTDQIRIPFHVGEDRSRTWILHRTEEGLKLQHDHRHEDGTPAALTLYGGDSRGRGKASRQEFPADRESRALFRQQNLPASNENVWVLEIDPESKPNRTFAYELVRPGRRFRVEFDLTRRVPNPPPTWAAQAMRRATPQ
jgi:hypothetical protein